MTNPKPRIPTDEELRRITTRAVAEIVPQREFVDGLRSGRRLRLKMGFDPTKPVITLGWAVGLRKLRQLQDLGHTVVVIIGDWTARIGDPSGQSQTRSMLTAEEVQANSEAILRQFYKVLDESRTEIRRQSEWFDGFTLTDVVRLAARVTVAQILERDDFAQRFAAHKPIGLHELLYPLLQAYDSVAVEADMEFGGTDQKFNILLGRELQRAAGQKAGPAGEGQAVLLVPLLVGLDGTQKMSQSLGNFIAIDDPPHEMYGKLMSIPDTLIMDYFELLTSVPDGELADIRQSIEKRTANPMEHKMRLAREVVSQFHSWDAAEEANAGFERTFRKRELPEEQVPVVEMPFRKVANLLKEGRWARPTGNFEDQPLSDADARVRYDGVDRLLLVRAVEAPPKRAISEVDRHRQGIESGQGIVLSLYDIIEPTFGLSRLEANRIVAQGGVDVDGEKAASEFAFVRHGSVLRVGKHRFLRIVDADKR
ncbi:MAG: tyrosine--tRNA ligase [Dehalococcoidia bacterium]|nr:tyrosine--tRNA ligase [Dehalococcoidia bacterium]